MVPDGVVPAALIAYLEGVGARRGEAGDAAARAVAELCEALHWAELARAREMAAQLDGLGLHLPDLCGGAAEDTTPCDACGAAARRLFHVRRGTPRGDKLVADVDTRLGEAAARRVGRRGEQTRRAVAAMHA